MYADFDADNLLAVVKRHHLELVRQADQEKWCRTRKPPAARPRGWKLLTTVGGVIRSGLWLYARGRELMQVRKIPMNERRIGSSRTNKGVQACRAVK